MLLRQVAALLLLTVVSVSDAQRRTWKTPGTGNAQGQRNNSRPFQRFHLKRSQEEFGHQSQHLPRQNPAVVRPEHVQDTLTVQSQQLLQVPVKKINWKFPTVPQQPQHSPGPFQLKRPVASRSVAVDCGEDKVYVEVKQNLFGTGQLLRPSAIKLGSCGPIGQDLSAHVLIFEAELQACNSTLRITKNELIYSFMLTNMPEVHPGTPITRVGAAEVSIECHYPRKKNVSSSALLPEWVPYTSSEVVDEELIFFLSLMSDDWQHERPSNQYFLGDLINIQASVTAFNHISLRVFVDSCVATPVPDMNAEPRYNFIEQHGCLVDGKITGSNSHFLPQDQNDKLRFQLQAFRFPQVNSSTVYVTCFLKVKEASFATDAENKACSFSAKWTAAYGDDQVCGCCDTSCALRKQRHASSRDLQMKGIVTLGPVLVDGEDIAGDETESIV